MFIRMFTLPLVAIVLVACQDLNLNQGGAPSSPDNDPPDTRLGNTSYANKYGTVTIDWQHATSHTFQDGVRADRISFLSQFGGHTYCFENTYFADSCETANQDIRTTVSSAPVAIQGLQFNFSYQSYSDSLDNDYSDVVIEAAWVKTAEVDFHSSTGALVLRNPSTRVVHGNAASECDLSDSSEYVVGYHDPNRILTGIYVSDEYIELGGGFYSSAFITAAQVKATGIVPSPEIEALPTDPEIYFWQFIESNSYTNFGLNSSFQEHSQANSLKVSNYFGWNEEIPNSNHVVVGLCIKGYKEFADDGSRRPLIRHLFVRKHKPKLVFQAN